MKLVSITLGLIPLKSFPSVLCTRCRSALELHQPDVELSERLLGICLDCKSWYLIDGARCIMVSLPDDRSLQVFNPPS
jgi:hypothetical protein